MVSNRLDLRRVAGLAGASLTVVLLTCSYSFAFAANSSEEQATEIIHQPLRCWPAEEYVVLSADVRPPDDIQKATVYFRWDRHAAWYFVPMTLNAQGAWVAILPKTEPATTGIVYNIESISSSYMATRSDEVRVPVRPASQCDNAGAVIFTGSNPSITLGATSGTPLAPGFQAAGVSSFISPTGVTSAVTGGGVSGRTIALIGGAGGAAAFFALSSGGNGDTTTTSDGIGGITTTIGTTTTVTGGGPSSTTTTVSGGGTTTVIGGGSTTTVQGGGPTTTTPGSSTTTPGSSTTTPGSTTTTPGSTTTTPGSTTTTPGSTTTTAASTTTTAASTTTTASSTSTPPSGADMRLDSITVSVLGPGIWTFNVSVTNLGPATAPSVLLTFSLPAGDKFLGGAAGCFGGFGFGQCGGIGSLGSGRSASRAPKIQLNGSGSHRITVTVGGGTTDPNTGNNQRSVIVNTLRTTDGTAPVAAIRSTIDVRPWDGHIRARITINDTGSKETNNSGPRLHRFTAQSGENLVEAQVELGAADSGTWRFDLSPTETFVPGSLRVQSGQAIAQDANSITFGLDGEAIQVGFTFELSEGTH